MSDKNKYGIAEALSEALEAAVFADSSASNKAYDMIEKYAYGVDLDNNGTMNPDGNEGNEGNGSMKKVLDMAVFTISGPDGTPREVSIPKITMMPLPLLHVTEATFDIEMTANIETVKTSDSQMNPTSTPSSGSSSSNSGASTSTGSSSSSSGSTITRPTPSRTRRPTSDSVTTQRPVASRVVERGVGRVTTSVERRRAIEQVRIPTSATSTNQQMVVGGKTTSTESNESTINMKVRINMEQAELPEGIKLLLQAAANSLQVAAAQINGTDPEAPIE